ncbi:hypothetical protein V2J09_023385 [Rumex salicifolius]
MECRYMLKHFKTDILALLEPQVLGYKAQAVCDGLGFSNNFRVETVGASGGVWLLWNECDTSVQVIDDATFFIHVKCQLSSHCGVQFWDELNRTIASISEPCFIGGDFNVIISLSERQGGSVGLMPDSAVFSDLINRRELIDMRFSSSKFTWRRGAADAPTVSKRLDRFLMNIPTRTVWDEAAVSHLPAVRSDHNPLLLLLRPAMPINPLRRPFRFEAMWLTHPDCTKFIDSNWQRDIGTIATLFALLRDELIVWNKDKFGNVFAKKDKLLRRIQDIDSAIANGGPSRLMSLQNKLRIELELVLLQEKMFWFQKVRCKWIECGDRNTAFFHTSVVIRRRRNRISTLKDSSGNWITDSDMLESMVVDYFAELFTLPVEERDNNLLAPGGFPRISNSDLLAISTPFSDDEIWASVRCMGAYKALGIDGFQSVFYHSCWVNVSVCRFIREFFTSGHLPTEVNATIIHLTGKVANSEFVSHFRPISLFNALYKMITKILAHRL